MSLLILSKKQGKPKAGNHHIRGTILQLPSDRSSSAVAKHKVGYLNDPCELSRDKLDQLRTGKEII